MRPLALIALAVATGIALAPPGPFWLWLGAAAVLLGWLGWRAPGGRGGHALAALAFLLLGAGLVATARSDGATLESLAPDVEVVALARVVGPVERLGVAPERRSRFEVELAEVELGGERLALQGRVRVLASGDAAVLHADTVRLRGVVRVPAPQLAPGLPDRREQLALRGIRRELDIGPAASVAVLAQPSSGLRRWLYGLRERLAARIDERIPGEDGAIARALLLGDRGGLGDELRESYAIAGAAHLLAISGLHVVLAGLVLAWVVTAALKRVPWLLRRTDVRAPAALAALPALWMYVVLIGAPASAVRAAVMVSALQLAVVVRRESDPWNALSLAALVLLCGDPLALYGADFQLSFAAVAGLLALAPAWSAWVPRAWPRLARWAAELVLATAAATVATAPLVAALFHRVSLVGLVGNLVFVPLGGAALVVAGFAWMALALLIPPLATPLEPLLELLGLALNRSVAWFAGWPLATLPAPDLGGWALAAMYLGILLWRFRPDLRGARHLGPVLVASVLAFAGAKMLAPRAAAGTLEARFLPVGQGASTLLDFADGTTMLVDGGGSPYGSFDPGAAIVAPILRALGVRRLDVVVATHPHPDHIQGLVHVLRELEVGELWYNGEEPDYPLWDRVRAVASERGVPLRAVSRGCCVFDHGGAHLEVLAPIGGPRAEWGANDNSVVMRVAIGGEALLLAGDVEAPAEEALLAAGPLGPAAIVKAPHHGSRTSSTEAFVEAARPHHVVFAVGLRNRFGFPHAAVVERYARHGAALWRTDLHGMLTAKLGAGAVAVTPYVSGEF